MTYEIMFAFYNLISVAQGYIIGFERNHKIYMVRLYAKHLPTKWLRNGHTSSGKGGVKQIKIYIPTEDRDAMIANGKAIYLGDESILNELPKFNRGENFERIVTERLTKKTWVKDRTPFYKDGDITYYNRKLQIKFNLAELTNENVLKHACEKLYLALAA